MIRHFVYVYPVLALASVGVGAWALNAPIEDWKISGPFGGTATTLAIDALNPSTVLAGAMNSLLFESRDSGASWTTLDLPKHNLGEVTAIMVDPANSGHYLVGMLDAFGGGLYESFDGGKAWELHPAFKNVGVRAIAAAPSSPSEFVAGTLQGVLLSTNSGKDWTRISDPNNFEMRGITAVAIDPKDPNVIYAGTAHLPWRTTNAGKTWESIHSGMIDDSDVFSIYIDPHIPTEVFASACSGIYTSPNRGDYWKKLAGIPNTSRRTHVIREDPVHEGTIYAGTTMGLFRSPNAGGNWKVLTSTQVNFMAFDPAQPASIYLAMENDGIGKSSDGGDTIQLMVNGFVDRQISALTRAGTKLVAIETQLGETTGIFVSTNGGTTWSQLRNVRGLGGVHLRSVAGFTAQDKTLVAASPRQLYKSVDGGVSWLPFVAKEVIEQAEPESKVVTKPRARAGAQTKSASARVAKPRIILRPLPPSDIYGLFALQQGGKDYIALATEMGLFLSEDAGNQWKRANLGDGTGAVTGLFVSPSGDGRMVAKTPESFYVSKDNGTNWQRVAFPLPMGDVNSLALPADPSSPLLVATRVGLFSSPDSGATWYAKAAGLQASTVSAVTYFGNSQTAYAIEYGQLYRSDDSGGTWSLVPSSLSRLPIRQLWVPDSSTNRLYAITSGLGILFRD
ncbi:MAG TPA: YCF48-related protein [Bryobacteraceae bacterium]|jgi:photosystem II stability/assembly factor-like uncharacterized protein|nr:YCF48-related protein [Bryobacteraceae bacterium]